MRQLDNKKEEFLYISPEELQSLITEYNNATTGVQKLAALQKLYDMLVVDLDKQLPDGKTQFVMISQDDILKKLSLPDIAKFVAKKDADHLQKVASSYVLPWNNGHPKFDRLAEDVQKEEQVQKSQSEREAAEKELKDKAGDKSLSEAISESTVEDPKMLAAINTLSQAPYIAK